MINVCPLCNIRVSEWMMAAGKTKIIRYDPALFRSDDIVHNACLIDYKIKYGVDYKPEGSR